MEWYSLQKEQEFLDEENKDNEQQTVEFEDVKCVNIYKCNVRKRMKFLMNVFKQYFLTKYVYNNYNDDAIEYISSYIKCGSINVCHFILQFKQ